VSVIAGVHGAVPPHRYSQDEITDAFVAVPAFAGYEKAVRSLHASAKVDGRNLILPIDEYPMLGDRIVSNRGLDIAPREYDGHFVEEHVERSNALHSRRQSGETYLCGPLARFSLQGDRLSPLAREAAREAGLEQSCRNPFQSIVVRSVEIVHACEEALRIVDAYEEPDAPAVAVEPVAGIGYGVSEAPRGLLYHRYELADDGTILDAKIVPPTSQNQLAIEDDLRDVVGRHVTLADDELRDLCEQTIRNYDPCISCATHFLTLEVERA